MAHSLTQREADALLFLEKHCDGALRFDYPDLGGSLQVPLFSSDRRVEFSLDIHRGKIELSKNTYQTRTRTTIVLARLDIGGSSHRNPDGEEIACPHLHLYKEGFGDKWAYPLPDIFVATSDYWEMLLQFMNYCNIATKPNIARGLFQ
jgi:hypothetical protein